MKAKADFSKREHVYTIPVLKDNFVVFKTVYSISLKIFFMFKTGNSVICFKSIFKLFKTFSLMSKVFRGFLGGNRADMMANKIIFTIESGHNSQLKKMELCRIFTKSMVERF